MSTTGNYVYDIYYEPETAVVVMNWNGYATSAQFREGTEIMLNTLVKNSASRVLANIQDMLVIGMDDQHWLENNFLPRAINQGFKAVAMVKPKNYFNKVAVETVSYKIDQENLTINFFDTVAEARNWIENFT